MGNKQLTIWAVTATVIAIATTVLLIIRWNSSKPCIGTYQPCIEPAKEYINVILDTTEYDNIYAVESLSKLSCFYNELSFLYELYLADFRNEPYACYNFYSSIESLYNKIGAKIPADTFNLAFELLKRGATHGKDENGLNFYEYCYIKLYEIYNEGVYVPRDTSLANHYLMLAKGEKKIDRSRP